MNKTSLTLYGSEVKLSNAHKCVTNPGQPSYYIRADLFHGDVGSALDKARPLVGEAVVNTVPVSEPASASAALSSGRLADCACGALMAYKTASGSEASGMDLVSELLGSARPLL